MKSLVRRRKKQLFGKQRKRKKTRYKRSFLSPFVGWIFGNGEKKSTKIENENIKVETDKFKVNTLLEIARKKSERCPE